MAEMNVQGVQQERVVYEDAAALAFLPGDASAVGHVRVVPKKKVQSLEELDDDVVVQLFYIASYAASSVFEALGAQGTNIIVHNGKIQGKKEEFLHIDVLPRREDDGFDFKWESQQLKPEEMDGAQKSIKDKADYIGVKKSDKDENGAKEEIVASSGKPKDDETKHTFKEPHIDANADEDNYLIKQLTRVP